MTHCHILTVPRELLDEIIPFLDANSMMRFCRAISQLNDYASTIYKAGQTLKQNAFMLWPNYILINDPSSTALSNPDTVTAVTSLITRFGGSTDISDRFTLTQIEHICAISSRNIRLALETSGPDLASEWARHIIIQQKRVTYLSINLIKPHHRAEMVQAIAALNPVKLDCYVVDNICAEVTEEFKDLRALDLRYPYLSMFFDEQNMHIARLSEFLPRLQSLRHLSMSHCSDTVVKDLVEVLPCVMVFSIELSYPQWDNQIDCEGGLSRAGFVKSERSSEKRMLWVRTSGF